MRSSHTRPIGVVKLSSITRNPSGKESGERA